MSTSRRKFLTWKTRSRLRKNESGRKFIAIVINFLPDSFLRLEVTQKARRWFPL